MDAVGYIHLRGGDPLPSLSLPPFKAILIAQEVVETAWRSEVCAWLIRTRCLSFAAWGAACEMWHDDLDHANIAEFEGRDIPDDRLVMTTWHDREPLSKALWFMASVAFHPTVELENALIVHVARNEREEEFLKQYHVAAAE